MQQVVQSPGLDGAGNEASEGSIWVLGYSKAASLRCY